MTSKPDVLLINMPFSHFMSPSIGLGLLKASLSRNNIDSRVLYLNVRFAQMIGPTAYQRIFNGTYSENLVGEWIFSDSLFQGKAASGFESYLNEILRIRPLGSHDDHDYNASVLEQIASAISIATGQVEIFLKESLDIVTGCEPKIVGFTSLFHQHVASLSLAKRIKAKLPNTFVVFGGPNCEGVMGRETLKQFDFVDAVVSGEGEYSFPEMVRRRLRQEPVSDLEGVFVRRDSHLRVLHQPVKNTPMIRNMDELPIPDYDDYFQQLRDTPLNFGRQPTLLFETSRGCWWGEKHHCTFCGLNGGNMAYRSKSAQRALDELVYLSDRYPGYNVNVVDNILDMDYFKDFIPLLAERKQKLNLFYEVKANLKKDQLRLLRAAGIGAIQPGIESFSDNVLRIMRKGVSTLQNIQLIKWCKELGLDVTYHIIWGFPGETAEDYLEMSRLIPLISHLPPPLGSATIGIHRFSPNFDDAPQLGFTNLSPHPAYGYVYPFKPEVLANLAYFFTFDYAKPRNVVEYVTPLADQIAKWKDCHRKSNLFWMEKGDRLLIWDFRPIAKRRLTVLSGYQKLMYMACDQITTPRQVFGLCQDYSAESLTEDHVVEALEDFTARGLMLASDNAYLALASNISH